MTLKEAKAIVKVIGFTLTKQADEYRLNIILGSEATAYCTNDLQDAVDTAKSWYARNVAQLERQLRLDLNNDGMLPTIH